MAKLEGKTVIITGASGGIGAASAALFSREAARLVLTGRDEARLREAANACDPERTRWIVADATEPADAARVVGLARESFGNLHALFANAGYEGVFAPLVSLPLDDFDRVWRTNVRGTIAMMQQAIPLILASGGGSIIATSSVASIIGAQGATSYAASKSALLGIVRTAAVELGRQGIRVNAIIPGPVENRMLYSCLEQAAPGYADAAFEQAKAMIPMGRYGTNEEIAKLASFLVSDDSSYCTGAAFVADGGMVIN